MGGCIGYYRVCGDVLIRAEIHILKFYNGRLVLVYLPVFFLKIVLFMQLLLRPETTGYKAFRSVIEPRTPVIFRVI